MATYTDNFNSGTTDNTLPTYSANWATPTGASPLEIGPSNSGTQGVRGNSAGENVNYYNNTFADKHYAKCGWFGGGGGGNIGPAIRIQSGAISFYYCYATGGNVFTGQMIAGEPSDWDAGQAGVNDGDVIELAVDATTATTIHYKVNGSIVATYTGKSALSGGFAGISSFDFPQDITADNWEGGDVVTDAAQPFSWVHRNQQVFNQ